MLDTAKLEQLRQAAVADDWITVGKLYIELSLETNGASDQFFLEPVAHEIRSRDARRVAAVVDELMGAGGGSNPQRLCRRPNPVGVYTRVQFSFSEIGTNGRGRPLESDNDGHSVQNAIIHFGRMQNSLTSWSRE